MSRSRFASNPSDAVEMFYRVGYTMERLRSASKSGVDVPGFSHDADWADWDTLFTNCPVYFFSRETADLISQASASYPLTECSLPLDEALNRIEKPSFLPSLARAFAVFESPVLPVNIGGVHDYLSAVIWMATFHVKRNEFTLGMLGIGDTFWGAAHVAAPIWWSICGADDVCDAGQDPDGTFRAEQVSIMKWICTASTFVEQEIFESTAVASDRAARRRCAKDGIVLPNCNVIRLRRIHHSSSTSLDGGNMEWSHRWIVRGHWRNQFFPSRGMRAPMWIHPHVKGPGDKPLLVKDNVFAVVR